ncbi:hypothetical protein FVEG_16920 [Fusarium verticillioides 7600]|uniref:mRNA stability protein n=1 Tax=Gibberella moniliformis (strain M3125 / FGSC 7600) TaxID=334819 RepID=W7MKY1_GIBM7|nr:hypothetical protein FVEG_16920 [Fusarium verticillioides 7600]XP_018758284.1 hypothetical protein FVEG_16920 [Fusarium verticillioides 7600]EWG52092.1 hypothetical protein FVEG_16920 [Fusarium verticillioides 7600]EWG52093.1 hypothetical protein FVEG_16920 [Fusarium verticillioides 7600]
MGNIINTKNKISWIKYFLIFFNIFFFFPFFFISSILPIKIPYWTINQTKSTDMDTDNNKRLLNRYGILPKRGSLLNHQLEGRKYFDSGDFALNQAHQSSNIGNVKTGREHPIRQDISEPSSSVPSSSNIDDNATQQSSTRRRSTEVKFHAQTQLHQEMKSPPESENHGTEEGNNE